ncbi:hypothetical protein I41_01570 [Lacipirellula limnantheis]|uniref:C-type lectin domain-containing protein n=2 Tax=Lacipirellula limnantheis TaxID=2528024 RepID=A0A517TRJ7_9BACT|nr:hypothetical protein I41_01570 [Lacipirellula limnantheis]
MPAFAWMSEPARNPDNGHYYAFFNGADDERFVRRQMPFAVALTRAASMSHLGIPGHLATITSQAEEDFVLGYFKELGGRPFSTIENYWIAASDAAVEGEWRWVAGPEAGQQFWQGEYNGQALDYQNWLTFIPGGGPVEPDNKPMVPRLNPEGEDYLALSLYETSWSYWNDVIGLHDPNSSFSPHLAIVEFSVPEPSVGALITIAGSMLVASCRRRAKSEARR